MTELIIGEWRENPLLGSESALGEAPVPGDYWVLFKQEGQCRELGPTPARTLYWDVITEYAVVDVRVPT